MSSRSRIRLALLWMGAVGGLSGCGNGGPVDAGLAQLPIVDALNPSSTMVGLSALQLHVEGAEFTSTSVVQWMGAPLSTTFVSSQELVATVPASDLAESVQALVTVYDSASGYSNAVSFGVFDPHLFPTVTSLSPAALPLGSPISTLLLTGTNFVPQSVALWNGVAALTTNYLSSTQLEAQIGSFSQGAASAVITVVNPPPGGGSSEAIAFYIYPPAPILDVLSPSSVIAGSTGVEVSLNGSNFSLSYSTVLWNGVTPLSAGLFSTTEFSVSLDDSMVADAGVYMLSVVNSPDGGIASLPFTVTPVPAEYPRLEIAQASNDLVWNASAGVIYISVPASAPSYANSIAAIDPDAGVVVASRSTSSEPGPLAVSEDGQFLYAALNGVASVQRFSLPALTPSLNYSLGTNPSGGAYYTIALQVAPGLPHTTAVALGVTSEAETPAILIFDDAKLRGGPPPSFSDQYYGTMQWGADAAHLYAANTESSSFDFYMLSVDAGGASLVADHVDAFPGFKNRIHFDPGTGFVYGDDGYVLNPATGLPVGIFQLPVVDFVQPSALMVPDSRNGRAFFLISTPDVSGAVLQVFDLAHFTPITSVRFPNLQGTPQHFIRWGAQGLAFTTNAGFLYVLSGAFVDGSN